MKLMCLVADRKELVNAINKITGEKMKYQGPPTFNFEWEDVKVLRDGTLEVADVEKRKSMLAGLTAMELIEDAWDEERDQLVISLPMEGHTGLTLLNLVSLFYSKGEIINRALGTPRAFEMNERFIELLTEQPPETAEDFLSLWEQAGSTDATRGIEFDSETITLTGFPYTEDSDWITAYTQLAGKINQLALHSKRIRLKKTEIENEKYTFRVWLVRLGFDGEEYKASRKLLLSRLSGHTAFRTAEQKEVHHQKYLAKKEAAHEESEVRDRD